MTDDTPNGHAADTADLVRATAHLPGLDVEVARWRSAAAEHVAISVKATPSFVAVGRAFEAANPFALWMRSAELAWLPWLVASRALMAPWVLLAAPPQRGERDS